MPKKKAQNASNHEEEKRAPGLTFGSFLFPEAVQTSANPQEAPTQPSQLSPVVCKVKRTKKGNAPVSVESCFGGRKLTVVSNVSGDASSLLKELKSKLGTGGELKEGRLELQGDHSEKVAKFLKDNKYLA